MKKLLILGGNGMLGHKAFQLLSSDYDTWATLRSIDQRIKHLKLLDREKIISIVNTNMCQ